MGIRGQIKDKPYRDALRLELAAAGEDHKALRRIARNHIALAQLPEMSALSAIKELADRIDGKVPQAVVGDAEHDPIAVTAQVSELEAARRIAFVLRSAIDKAEEVQALPAPESE